MASTFSILSFAGQDINVLPKESSLEDIAKTIAQNKDDDFDDRSFYVFNCDKVFDLVDTWKKELPLFKPYYAVKCNNDPVLLSILLSLGCGFDCASMEEIDHVMALGVEAKDILFAQPFKKRSQIKGAAEKGIVYTIFDSEEELIKLKEFWPQAQLILRIACNDPTAILPLADKFGAEPMGESGAVAREMRKLTRKMSSSMSLEGTFLLHKAAKLGFNVCGTSFHVGSWCQKPEIYQDALAYCKNLFNIGMTLGHKMHIVDIGGGFPGYDTEKITFAQCGIEINEGIEEYFLKADNAPNMGNLNLIAEPGRFLVETTSLLCFNVISKIALQQGSKANRNPEEAVYKYILSEGRWGAFSMPIVPQFEPLFPEDNKGKTVIADMYGPTCDSRDLIVKNASFPDVKVGTWLVSKNKGAYTLVCSTNFNGFTKPQVYHFISEKKWMRLESLTQSTEK